MITITFACPLHPKYTAFVRPTTTCKACRLLFDLRNNAHRTLSTPVEERTEIDEIIVRSIE